MNIIKSVKRGFKVLALAFGVTVSGVSASAATVTPVQYSPVTLTEIPAVIAASTTVTSNEVVTVTGANELAITLSGSLANTNPAAATLSIPVHRSVDGTTFESTAVTTLVLTFTGTQTKVWSTNMNIGGFGYLRFGPSIASTATNATVGVTVKVAAKPPLAVAYPNAPVQ